MAAYEDKLGEIDLERSRYLLNIDKLMEELLTGRIPDTTIVDWTSNDKTKKVCCGVLIETMQSAETVDLHPVCINNCIFIENGAILGD